MNAKNVVILLCLIAINLSCQKSNNQNTDEEKSDHEESALVQRESIDINPGSDERLINNLIQVESPKPNTVISSPLKITGKARGYWFFEADFPVELVDSTGNSLGIAIASAQDEWMTEDFVRFSTELQFQKPKSSQGYLIFNRSNASGLPEHDRALKIPVYFEQQ